MAVRSNTPTGLADFRVFLAMCFKHLRLPEPSAAQIEVADILQHCIRQTLTPGSAAIGTEKSMAKYPMLRTPLGDVTRRLLIETYRGFGKSLIVGCFNAYILFCNANKKIVVVSATHQKAGEQSHFSFNLFRTIPAITSRLPQKGSGLRCNANQFDVCGTSVAQAPSLRAIGIGATITGSRADVIILDDIESSDSCDSPVLQAETERKFSELTGAILSPRGLVIALGTPQYDRSLYNDMRDNRDYTTVILPVMHPDARWMAEYGPWLAPCVARNPLEPGAPTDRFDADEIAQRRLDYGPTQFDLQFMLDTASRDLQAKPLKLADILVVHSESIPTAVQKGALLVNGLSVGICSGAPVVGSQTIMFVDPAGGNTNNETAYSILTVGGGYFLIMDCGAVRGYADDSIRELIAAAKKYSVTKIVSESNMGSGMFDLLLRKQLSAADVPMLTDTVHNTGNKYTRMLGVLEPVIAGNMLLAHSAFVDVDLARPRDTSLLRQIADIAHKNNSLVIDDKIDSLASAVAYGRATIPLTTMLNERMLRSATEAAMRRELFGDRGKCNFLAVAQ